MDRICRGCHSNCWCCKNSQQGLHSLDSCLQCPFKLYLDWYFLSGLCRDTSAHLEMSAQDVPAYTCSLFSLVLQDVCVVDRGLIVALLCAFLPCSVVPMNFIVWLYTAKLVALGQSAHCQQLLLLLVASPFPCWKHIHNAYLYKSTGCIIFRHL